MWDILEMAWVSQGLNTFQLNDSDDGSKSSLWIVEKSWGH